MISSVKVLNVLHAKRSKMEVSPVSLTVPTVWEKEYIVQSVAKIEENKYKITNTIYNVITYDRNGNLDQSTNIRYFNYIV